MEFKNNYNLKKDSKFLKITTGVVAVTLAVGFSNEYFNSIKPNLNTYSFAAAPEASSSSGVIASGNCGEEGHEAEVIWQLTQNEGSDTYTLTIEGNGRMMDSNETIPHTPDEKNILMPWKANSDKITKVIIKGNVSYIGAGAFYKYQALREIDLSSVTKIGYRAFSGCGSLQRIINSDQVRSIDSRAFEDCSALTEVSMENVETINGSAFNNCKSLNTINFPNVRRVGALEDKDGIFGFIGCVKLQEINIPHVEIIGQSAFLECESLEKVEMPNVQTIGAFAFANCDKLQGVEMPNVRKIGTGAFNSCSSLKEVLMPSKTTVEMGNDVFEGCGNIVFQTPQQAGANNNQNVDLEDNEDDGNILLDKELTDIEPVETSQEVATETTETTKTSETSQTTDTTTNTNIPNTGAKNNGLLAAMLTTLGGALGLIFKKHRENN